ncbi:hypothetical protein DQM20_14185 [Lactiplantibacillus plantarum]|uniref:hypothetical protein n=1 Tax=Lactiplantibacillus plantarum TaxID=1590 RepID=UPI000E093C91|nr:hypothetical protein [Lactiplantibacillus plantarum]RDG23989.1 hypothetical protein DQM20_14185 [Lactiplantibacillus plantarum]
MFGKNRTAPVPAHGKHSLSLKQNNRSEYAGLIADKATINVTKQPHVRIEFDDIVDTPKVFIDGVEQENVQHINLTWYKPDMEDNYAHGRYRIEMADKQRRLHGIGQGK